MTKHDPSGSLPPRRRSPIERFAQALGILSRIEEAPLGSPGAPPLRALPPPEDWDAFEEDESRGWPARTPRRRMLVPTACFNCESACGLLAVVDRETGETDRFEGNPLHPASRGRLCAKGPATINQVRDPDRILHPMRRNGPRGSGAWRRATWDEALDDIAGRIRRAIQENRHDEIVYHVGRPGHEGFAERVLAAWGVDGHQSHTNVCSSGARLGYMLWWGHDRPSPDFAQAKMVLLLSSHLEAGHYFNPHAQRIVEGLGKGAKLAVVDTRHSNTASKATWWFPTRPGTEATLLLAMAHVLLKEDGIDREFVETWVNWQDAIRALAPKKARRFPEFVGLLKRRYAAYTPERAARECGVSEAAIVEVARAIAEAGPAFSAHVWRNAASAHLGGWQVARALMLLSVLVGAVSTPGGTWPNGEHKFHPALPHPPPPPPRWNELLWPREYPLAHYEMSPILPHLLLDGRGRIDTYFTRVCNPVWTYPDGGTWIRALREESLVGCHVAMTPTWNETALFADWVLPMGHAPERHDLCSYETHRSTWIAFRQPVRREWSRRVTGGSTGPREDGGNRAAPTTRDTNPGEVWEEDEFWIELSWRIDPDGTLGIRRYFETPGAPGRKMIVDDYYAAVFEKVPGLPEAARAKGWTPLEYMRRVGAFEVCRDAAAGHLAPIPEAEREGAEAEARTGTVLREGKAIGVDLGKGRWVRGFPTPSRKLEFFSKTLQEWGWPEFAIPQAIESHVAESQLRRRAGEMVLLPTFRLPNHIHSRSGNAKWLLEIAQRNPIWLHPEDARRIGVARGDAVRVTTEIGYFVDRVWVTEAIRPGVVACSHHLGRWRRLQDPPGNRMATHPVELREESPGVFRMRRAGWVEPFPSDDPDTMRVFWNEGGVPQNLTHGVHPDPLSGMHAWHQKVRVARAQPMDREGDVWVDGRRSMAVFREWLDRARPAPGPEGLRRPRWLKRPLRPAPGAYELG